MKQTKNYTLNKIELADSPPNIEVINPNWDKIDTELKAHQDALDSLDKNLSESDENFSKHVEFHIQSYVVSERLRDNDEFNYGLS